MKEPEPKETQGAASAAWQLFCQTGLRLIWYTP